MYSELYENIVNIMDESKTLESLLKGSLSTNWITHLVLKKCEMNFCACIITHACIAAAGVSLILFSLRKKKVEPLYITV